MEYFSFNFETVMTRLDVVLIALCGVMVAAMVVGLIAKITRRAFAVMPLFEMVMRPIAVFLIDRLNRHNRGAFSLIVRGVVVFTIMVCIAFFTLWAARHFVPYHYVDILFLIFVLSPLSSIFIALQLSKSKPEKRTYFHVAQALNRNLIKVDEAGHRRNAFDLLALSLGEWFIAPVFFYMVGGVGFAYFYCVLSLFCRVAGAQGQSTLFASLFCTLWTVMQIIPRFIGAVMIVISSLFTPKGKMISAMRVFLLRPLGDVYAYAIGITIGGAYQDRHGNVVERAWVGASKSSAKLTHEDVLRGCYLHGIALLLTITCLVSVRLVF